MQLIIDGVKNDMMKTGFPVHDQNLDTNWRSKKEIVDFNNTFFPSAAISESLRFESGGDIFTQAYSKESLIQKTKGNDEEGGYIEFKFFESDKKDKNPDSNIVHWKTKALLHMESTLEKLISSGYKPGDIAILVRTNFHENEISDFLFKNGKYAFISSNSLKLATHRTIGVLLNCMRILLHPEEALLHAEVNHFVKNMIEDSTIPFKSEKLFSENTSWTYHHLIKKKEHLNTLPLQLLYYHLLDQLNLNLTDPFIQKFSDILLDYTGSKGNNVSGFIKWWDEHVDTRNWSVELPGGGNAIRIITIHRSKGLEFPIVILPFLDWSLTPSSTGIIWAKGDEEQFRDFGKLPLFAVKNLSDSYFSNDYYQETLETAIDNLNLLYVAFTRPEEKLFVFGPTNPSENEVGRLVINTISENEKWGEKFIANEYKEFIIGEFHNKAQKEKTTEKEGLYNPSGFTPVNLPEYNGEYPVLPELKLAFTSKEIILGNLVHDTIAETTDERTIEKTVDLILSKNGNQAYYNLKEELTNQVKDVWRILDKQGWTSKDFIVVNEAELCDETGALHRPDKVLIKGHEAIVIDFKTGLKDPKHHVQVKEYCRLLRETGLQNISAYLLYTIDKEIVKIDWPETNVTGRITLFD